MSRRHTARRRDRWQAIVASLLILALALVALYVWWGIEASSSHLAPAVHQAPTKDPRSPSREEDEEFSEAERHGLEEILRRHGAGKSQ